MSVSSLFLVYFAQFSDVERERAICQHCGSSGVVSWSEHWYTKFGIFYLKIIPKVYHCGDREANKRGNILCPAGTVLNESVFYRRKLGLCASGGC